MQKYIFLPGKTMVFFIGTLVLKCTHSYNTDKNTFVASFLDEFLCVFLILWLVLLGAALL